MNTQRYLLRYVGSDAMPAADVTDVAGQTRVLDRSRHCLLVEDTPEHLRQLLKSLTRWRLQPERRYQPLTRPSTP